MIVSLNGVIQKPTDAFTVSGSTITFASNLVTGDVINFIQILGNVLDLGVPSDSTVSIAKLTATGTKNSTTFLRGDNTFAAAGGTNTPAFMASSSSDQTINQNTWTKLTFSNEVYDVGGVYDHSTNYRFTPGFSGKSNISAGLWTYDAQSAFFRVDLRLYKNGSYIVNREQRYTSSNTTVERQAASFNVTIEHDDNDYFEMFGLHRTTDSGSAVILVGSGNNALFDNYFTAFKIIE
jgi:hypothetical protein